MIQSVVSYQYGCCGTAEGSGTGRDAVVLAAVRTEEDGSGHLGECWVWGEPASPSSTLSLSAVAYR